MKSCGIVGQPEISLMPSRTMSVDSTLYAVYATPYCFSTSTAFAEKPQRGASGSPFMKSTTSWPLMSFFISSTISFLSASLKLHHLWLLIGVCTGEKLGLWTKVLTPLAATARAPALHKPLIIIVVIWLWMVPVAAHAGCAGERW